MGRVGFEIEQHVQKMEYKTMHVAPVEGKPLASDGLHLWPLRSGINVMVAPNTNTKGKGFLALSDGNRALSLFCSVADYPYCASPLDPGQEALILVTNRSMPLFIPRREIRCCLLGLGTESFSRTSYC